MRWTGNVARLPKISAYGYKFLVDIPEVKRPLERSRCRCGDNIEMDLMQTEWESAYWTELVSFGHRNQSYHFIQG
jgi:hypothetical protein